MDGALPSKARPPVKRGPCVSSGRVLYRQASQEALNISRLPYHRHGGPQTRLAFQDNPFINRILAARLLSASPKA